MANGVNITSLIEVLTLIRERTGEISFPTHCEHDELYLCLNVDRLAKADHEFIEARGFIPAEDGFVSFHFGSA